MTPETGPASDPAVQPNVDGSEPVVAGADVVEEDTSNNEDVVEDTATVEEPAEEETADEETADEEPADEEPA